MTFSPDGQFLLVSDSPTKSVKMLRAIGHSIVRSIGQGTIQDPQHLAFAPGGNTVFVSDLELHAVLQYRMDGTLVRQIGSKGKAAGKFESPWGLTISKAGKLFVADKDNDRVQALRMSDGTFLRQIGGTKGNGSGQFNMPVDVALSPFIFDGEHTTSSRQRGLICLACQ